MGRRTKLTPEVHTLIVEAIMAGNYFEASCEYAGIDVSTGYNWMARGREGKNRASELIYVEFFEAVTRASARAEVQAVAKLRQHGNRDPRALIEFLRRRYPQRWGDATPSQEQEAATAKKVSASEVLAEIALTMRARIIQDDDEPPPSDLDSP